MKFKLFSFLLLTVFLFTGCGNEDHDLNRPAPPEVGDIEVREGMNLVGILMDDNDIPVVGAVVSDGYSVTTTDNDGIYQLAADGNARFVFVSVPSDYEIPMRDGQPAIYQSLPENRNSVIRRDFNLKKQNVTSRFRLLAMADVQIGQAVELDWLREGEMPLIVDYANTLKEDLPLYGISLGDLVWDNMPYLKEYGDEMKRLGIPVFHVIGNHDHDQTVINDDDASSHHFEANFGPTYYSYNIGECHFVVLDNVYYEGGSDRVYTGRITQNQLDWLEENLQHVSKDKLIVLGVHIPTMRRYNDSGITNRQSLYDVLEGYNVRILSGHRHNNSTATITDKIEENNIGAVMGAFWNDPCNDGSPRGYAVYEFDGNEITDWYYKGTETERDYQMILYAPGEAVTASRRDGIIINIFSWHTHWTVDVYENDTHVKTFSDNENLRSPFEMDRTAYNAYFGDNVPVHRPYAEPEMNNDHMFYYKPSATSGITVKVEAKDPYGNTYTESIELE